MRDPPAQPVKSPELLARLEKLQRAEDERQYKRMVHDVTDHVRPLCADANGSNLLEMKVQPESPGLSL